MPVPDAPRGHLLFDKIQACQKQFTLWQLTTHSRHEGAEDARSAKPTLRGFEILARHP